MSAPKSFHLLTYIEKYSSAACSEINGGSARLPQKLRHTLNTREGISKLDDLEGPSQLYYL